MNNWMARQASTASWMRCLNSAIIDRLSGSVEALLEIGVADGSRRQKIHMTPEKPFECRGEIEITIQQSWCSPILKFDDEIEIAGRGVKSAGDGGPEQVQMIDPKLTAKTDQFDAFLFNQIYHVCSVQRSGPAINRKAHEPKIISEG